jgi:hypothetical protein
MASGTCLRRNCTVCPEVLCSGRVNSRLCSYDLMCQSQSLSPASLLHSLLSLCSLDHPLLVSGTFPTLRLPNPSLDAWTYTPAASGVHPPVSSPRASAFPNAVAGRRSATIRATTSARVPISGLQSFLYVQASSFACHPGRSYRRNSIRHVAAVAFTSEHRMSCCLLTRRIC